MTKIDIFSGFLGAGKTTFIQKLIKEAYKNEQLILIENEFGEIGIDGGFLKEAGIEITEMNSGCICCSLVGDFKEALKKVIDEYHPDRILIEPSGVGKLSDVVKAVQTIEEATIDHVVTVADVMKCKMYMKNFGEFYNDQIEFAKTIVLSRTQNASEKKLNDAIEMIRSKNEKARILTTPWDKLEASTILEAMNASDLTIYDELIGHEDHEHHHHDEECCCGHEHHEHHHHEEGCCCGHDHHEHHHHEEGCCCGGHHGHHHADEVFLSVGIETVQKFDIDKLTNMLDDMSQGKYGLVIRAKGVILGLDNNWYQFNLTPDEVEVKKCTPGHIGMICVIGSGIDTEEVKHLFKEC